MCLKGIKARIMRVYHYKDEVYPSVAGGIIECRNQFFSGAVPGGSEFVLPVEKL